MNKRIPIILFFLMALCLSAHAQFISVHAEDPTNPGGTQTIVRSWNSNYAVSYYVDASLNPMMDLIDQYTGNIRRATLPNDVFIRDMYIDQATDVLYFCGATTMTPGPNSLYSGYGILGWIKLQNFFSSSISVGYIRFDNSSYILRSVNKLVEYPDAGTTHIVAIAENRNAVGSQFFFINCFGLSIGTPMLSVGDFFSHERYDDLLLTDGYVVFMGYDNPYGIGAMCYRKTNPYNIICPMFDSIHFFVGGNDPLSPTHSTVMPEDKIATSYWALNNNNDFVTRIRMIDIANDLNYNTQEFVIPEKTEPIDMVYIPDDNSLVLMEDFTTNITLTNNSNFVFLDPYAYSPYNTAMEYKKDEHFHSMTMHDAIYYLAGAGASWFFKYKAVSPTNSPDQDCPIVEKIDVDIVDNFEIQKVYLPPTINFYPYSVFSINRAVVSSQVIIICNNQ